MKFFQCQILLIVVFVLKKVLLMNLSPFSLRKYKHKPIYSNFIIDRFDNDYQQTTYRSLKRVSLSNDSITCNDGSRAGYYLRKAQYERKVWVIFLEGGWYCYDSLSCKARWVHLRNMMTSSGWTETREVGGILSGDSKENPFFWAANHVYIPYCSSDFWSGTRKKHGRYFAFMGSLILQQVVRDLIPLGLDQAHEVILAGSSAGGIGVMLNLDAVADLIHNKLSLPNVKVRGICDSGWFIDRKPFNFKSITAVESIKIGMTFWQGSLPAKCKQFHNDDAWLCYLGYRLYPHIKTPLFIFQWLFDEAQMKVDNVGAPVTQRQWDYVQKIGKSLIDSFENVTAVFAPSCVSHSVLSKREWNLVKINDISVPEAIECWLRSKNREERRKLKKTISSRATIGDSVVEKAASLKTNETRKSEKSQQRRLRLLRFKLKQLQHQHKGSLRELDSVVVRDEERHRRPQRRHSASTATTSPLAPTTSTLNVSVNSSNSSIVKSDKTVAFVSSLKKFRKNFKKRKNSHNNKRRQRRLNLRNDHNQDLPVKNPNDFTENLPQELLRRIMGGEKRPVNRKCGFRLIEKCTWPQCSNTCPQMLNPFTGEEIDFTELLESFGFNMQKFSVAVGIDLPTLSTMNHSEILNILNQRPIV